MQADDELFLKMTKEIVIKYIEMGRVSPTGFEPLFKSIFWTIKDTAVSARVPTLDLDASAGGGKE